MFTIISLADNVSNTRNISRPSDREAKFEEVNISFDGLHQFVCSIQELTILFQLSCLVVELVTNTLLSASDHTSISSYTFAIFQVDG
jgi:hypothetical protein